MLEISQDPILKFHPSQDMCDVTRSCLFCDMDAVTDRSFLTVPCGLTISLGHPALITAAGHSNNLTPTVPLRVRDTFPKHLIIYIHARII